MDIRGGKASERLIRAAVAEKVYTAKKEGHTAQLFGIWKWEGEAGPGWRGMSGAHYLRGPGAYAGVEIIIPTLSISCVSSFISKGM